MLRWLLRILTAGRYGHRREPEPEPEAIPAHDHPDLRAEVEALWEAVSRLGFKSRYIRRLLEARRTEDEAPDAEQALHKRHAERRAARWEHGRMVEVNGKRVVQDELGRDILEETGQSVRDYRDELEKQLGAELRALRARRKRAWRRAAALRTAVLELPPEGQTEQDGEGRG